MKKHKRNLVLSKTGGICFYCGNELGKYDGIDHMIPRSKGGTSEIGNLVPACVRCNSRKGKKTLEEFRSWIAFPVAFKEKQIDVLTLLGVWEKVEKFKAKKSSQVKFWFECQGVTL